VTSTEQWLLRRGRLHHLPAFLLPTAVTLLMLFFRLPEADWPAYGIVYLCSVVLVAVASGWKDAVVALVISGILLDYFFLGPVGDLSLPTTDDWAVFLSFVLSGTLVAVSIEWRRASEKRLKIGLRLAQAQAELAEARVLAGLREASGESGFLRGAAPGQVADSLERHAAALNALAVTAPAETGAALRDEASKLVEAARRVRMIASELDAQVRPQ
jgi:K+-sensing histidine kinase KdpD